MLELWIVVGLVGGVIYVGCFAFTVMMAETKHRMSPLWLAFAMIQPISLISILILDYKKLENKKPTSRLEAA